MRKSQAKTDGRSLKSRFVGEKGRSNLLDVLSEVPLLTGIPNLPQLLQETELLEFDSSTEIVRQGDGDNDLFIILSGTCAVEVNGRFWTSRTAGSHVGESAMIDRTARRNATVRASEDCLVLKCPEPAFSAFADQHPVIWRRLAVESGKRLTERTRLVPVRRTEPVLFVGCTVEAIRLAEEIQASFDRDPIIVKIWTDDVFQASKTAIEDLAVLTKEMDFAALLLTADDKVISRGAEEDTVRDNVIFEMGLAIGSIGRDRTFLLRPRGSPTKLPSDLLGVTPLDFAMPTDDTNIRAKLGPLCTKLRRLIKDMGPI